MFVAYLRHLVCAVTGRVACNMGCGRPARAFGYCIRHLDAYRYQP